MSAPRGIAADSMTYRRRYYVLPPTAGQPPLLDISSIGTSVSKPEPRRLPVHHHLKTPTAYVGANPPSFVTTLASASCPGSAPPVTPRSLAWMPPATKTLSMPAGGARRESSPPPAPAPGTAGSQIGTGARAGEQGVEQAGTVNEKRHQMRQASRTRRSFIAQQRWARKSHQAHAPALLAPAMSCVSESPTATTRRVSAPPHSTEAACAMKKREPRPLSRH